MWEFTGDYYKQQRSPAKADGEGSILCIRGLYSCDACLALSMQLLCIQEGLIQACAITCLKACARIAGLQI